MIALVVIHLDVPDVQVKLLEPGIAGLIEGHQVVGVDEIGGHIVLDIFDRQVLARVEAAENHGLLIKFGCL